MCRMDNLRGRFTFRKAYSVAYLEFSRGEDGSVTKIGPHGEKDELKLQDQWLVRAKACCVGVTMC